MKNKKKKESPKKINSTYNEHIQSLSPKQIKFSQKYLNFYF